MNKQEFLMQLKLGLSGLPQKDIDERLEFYNEMIEDRIEEGFLEEEAVRSIGDVEKVINQIVEEIPLSKLVKQKIKRSKQMRMWETILLIVGSPLWLSLLIAMLAVSLSVYISLWSIMVSLWSVFVALVGCAIGGIGAGIIFIVKGNLLPGVAMIGAALVCGGLSILVFYGCKLATKGLLLFTKKSFLGMKKWFVKKEEA